MLPALNEGVGNTPSENGGGDVQELNIVKSEFLCRINAYAFHTFLTIVIYVGL